MRKAISAMALVAIAIMCILTLGTAANAEEVKFVGVISKIEITGKEATTATATLTDNKTQSPVVITVNDDLTLDKFKDHRISEGDEIRCKYEVIDGKNVSKLFRKTAGC